MKVIFLEDIPNVATAGETKEVAGGYGRNFLLPRKLAVLADSKAAGVVKAHMKVLERRQAQTEAEMKELAKQLDGQEITIKAKAGEKERLFGSVTSASISDALNKSKGIAIDKKKIELAEAIHELGSYEVVIRLLKDVTPKLKVNVVREEEEKAILEVLKLEEKKEEKAPEEVKAEKVEEVPEKEVKAKEEGQKKEPKAKKEKAPTKEAEAKEESPKKEAKAKKEKTPEKEVKAKEEEDKEKEPKAKKEKKARSKKAAETEEKKEEAA